MQEHVSAPKDMRGNHLNRPNKIPEDIIYQVDTFIEYFLKRSLHYSKNKKKKNILSLSGIKYVDDAQKVSLKIRTRRFYGK